MEKSGMRQMADKFKTELLEEIRKSEPKTAYDVEEAIKWVVAGFNFGEDNLNRLKEYAFRSGKWGLSDILDVGAAYFRDIGFLELGFECVEESATMNNRENMKGTV